MWCFFKNVLGLNLHKNFGRLLQRRPPLHLPRRQSYGPSGRLGPRIGGRPRGGQLPRKMPSDVRQDGVSSTVYTREHLARDAYHWFVLRISSQGC